MLVFLASVALWFGTTCSAKAPLSNAGMFQLARTRFPKSIEARQSSQFESCSASEVVEFVDNYPDDCPSLFEPMSRDFCARPDRCGQPLVDFLFTCGEQGEALAELFIIFCGLNENNNFCVELVNNTAPIIFAAVTCPLQNDGVCPSGCDSILLDLRDTFGCCLNTLFNGTQFGTFDIVSNDLWSSCNVETPGFCESTLSSSARVTAIVGAMGVFIPLAIASIMFQ